MKHLSLFINFNNLRKISSCLCLLLFAITLQAKPGFAIIIDNNSYAQAQTEVNQYAQALEQKQGFKVYIVKDSWGTPQGIKAELKRLYHQKKDAIIGAVFIGDIPIAMIRHAQRLTTAFKMNENADWKESSIPSDSYYEDFQMTFNFLHKEATLPYFYFALSPSSTQQLQPNIFTGRIKPMAFDGVDKYERLRRYLRKVVQWKNNPQSIKQLLFFSGHGYISNSFVARMDEEHNLYEHFPTANQPLHNLRYLDFRFQNNTKQALMNELQRPDLDLALLHHHGAPDTQYLDAEKPATTAEEAKALIQDYGRSYVRKQVAKGMQKDSVTAKLAKRFHVPQTWFSNALDSKIKAKDSLKDAEEDLVINDFSTYNYKPNTKMVVLDACFNGSFHLDSCMAASYIFNDGQTIACIANSVNVLQDKWSDHYLGLMQEGLYAGNIARLSGYMESHCIGDPTFCFQPTSTNLSVNSLVTETNTHTLRKILKSNTHADIISLAMAQLVTQHQLTSKELFQIFSTSNKALIRIQALTLLAKIRDNNFILAIKQGAKDDNELLRRTALNYLGKNGNETLVPVLIDNLLDPNLSERCKFSVINSLSLFQEKTLTHTLDSVFAIKAPYYINKNQIYKQAQQLINNNVDKWWESIRTILDEKAPLKRRLMATRTTRNYCPYEAIPQLINCARNTTNEKIKIAILESLGWRYYSKYVTTIRQFAQEIMQNTANSEAVRQEAEQTWRALE